MDRFQQLPLGKRLAVLGAFNASVLVVYLTIAERSKLRGGDLERDGYAFSNMYKSPKHGEAPVDVVQEAKKHLHEEQEKSHHHQQAQQH